MAEVYPISCVSCRRKKIKCNKLKPCNQCKKRQIVCQFPSTFRNIEINSEEMKPNAFEEGFDTNADNCINRLKDENKLILNKNVQLNEQNKQLLKKINQFNTESNFMDIKNQGNININLDDENISELNTSAEPQGFKITGETSELGEKYYGPQSSKYMIETLKNSHMIDSKNYPQNYLDKDNEIKLGKSLIKKPLPTLKPGISINENMSLIYKLVEKFFQNYSSNYYKTFISKMSVMNFLNNYDAISNHLWENDDDLLLLLMILILAIERLTPVEIIQLFNIKNNDYNNFIYNLIHNNLFYNFEKLRHNLINESILTIQSYILCTEYFFIEQRYEEAWSMMFHTCSIAFSIGLHVTGKLKLNEINLNQEVVAMSPPPGSTRKHSSSSSSDESMNEVDELEDISKLKVWFSLRILSDKVCSILGRPNPISIQMNSKILKYNQNYANININQNKTSILLKIGLSECIRLSNMMLIENFMIDFTINDLLNLNSRFEKEINLLELYLAEMENNNGIFGGDTGISGGYTDNSDSIGSGPGSTGGIPSGTSEGFGIGGTSGDNNSGSMSLSTSNSGISNKSDANKLSKYRSTSTNASNSSNPGSSVNSGAGSNNHDYLPHDDLDTSNELSYDELNYLPLRIEKINLLNDLIVFYINKAKLFEPFIIKFSNNENDSILILKNLSNSIINFLKLIYKFFNKFEIQLSKKNLNYLKIGKYFRLNFPFLNSFIYQGIIIIFTLLNYKFKDFVQLKYQLKFDNKGFLNELKVQLLNLLSVDYNFNEKIWSINITYLINKNLELLDVIGQQQNGGGQDSSQLAMENHLFGGGRSSQVINPSSTGTTNPSSAGAPSTGNTTGSGVASTNIIGSNASTDTGSTSPAAGGSASGLLNSINVDMTSNPTASTHPNDIISFNLNDPFWITNPDNLPYYLGSPNEELQRQAEEELKNINQNSRDSDDNLKQIRESSSTHNSNQTFQQPQPSKDFLTINNQYEAWSQGHMDNDRAQQEQQPQHTPIQKPGDSDNQQRPTQSNNKKIKLEDFIPDPSDYHHRP